MTNLPPRPKLKTAKNALPAMPRINPASDLKQELTDLTGTLQDTFWEERDLSVKFGEPKWEAAEPAQPPRPKKMPAKLQRPTMPSISGTRSEGGLPQILTLTARDRLILTLIGANRRVTLNQIAEVVTASQSRPYGDVSRVAEGLRRGAIQKLKDLGLIKRLTPGKYAASSPFFILTEEAISAYPAAVWAGEPELLADDFNVAELDLIDHSQREATTGAAISLASGNMLIKHWDGRSRKLEQTTGHRYPVIPAHRIAMAKKDMTSKGSGTYDIQKKAIRAWVASSFPKQSSRDWDFFAPLPEQIRAEVEQGLLQNFAVDEHVATPPAFLFSSLDGRDSDPELLSFAIGRPNIVDAGQVYHGSAAARFDSALSESKEEKKMILWRVFNHPARFSQMLWITAHPEIETRVWEAWLSLIAEGKVKQNEIGWLCFGYYEHRGK